MRRVAPLLAAAALLASAAPAAAHVDVLPLTIAEGEATELIVRVPSERDLATTRVRVEVPEEVTVFSLAEPPAGWAVASVPGPDGRVRAVVWSGGAIPAGRYADFRMLATAFASGDVLWRARQTYADGRVKPWTAPATEDAAAETGPTDPGPGSPMTILAEGDAEPAAAAPTAGDDDSGAAIWLGVIAIGISALAALGVGLLWSTRPTRLPGDEEPPA